MKNIKRNTGWNILLGQCVSELNGKLPRRLNWIFTPPSRLHTRRTAAGLKPLAQYMEALRADERVAPWRHFHELRQGFIPPIRANASRNSLANSLAASTGLSLPPIVFTHAEPTMTPSTTSSRHLHRAQVRCALSEARILLSPQSGCGSRVV